MKFSRRIISLILILATLSGLHVPADAANGSMESWSVSYAGTLTAAAELDDSVYRSGTASVRLSRKSPAEDNVYLMMTQSVAVEAGKRYQYGFWAKAKNISGVKTCINWEVQTPLNPVVSTYDWTYFNFQYEAVKTGNVTFRIIVNGPSSAFWVDDLEFYEYNNGVVGENKFKNPGFEGANYSPAGTDNLLAAGSFSKDEFTAGLSYSENIPVYYKNDIVIDGDISDWEGATEFSDLPQDKSRHIQKYSTDVTDTVVEMRFAYDENYFYFLTAVDDNMYYERDGAEYWMGDSIQLALSSEDRSYGAEIGYNYNTDGGGKFSLDFGTNEMSSLLLKTVRQGNITYYESAIPWSLYYKKFMDKIKFSAIYNDNDGDGRKYAVQIAPGIAEGKTNVKFPTFYMVPDNTDFFVWVEGEKECIVFEENEYTVCILNNADEAKDFIISVDGKEKEVSIPANSGKRTDVTVSFDDVGNMSKVFSVSDEAVDYEYTYNAQVIATADYYDEALSELQNKIDEINGLIAECKEAGISTDYEEPVAFILERFKTHIRTYAENEEYDKMEYTFTELEEMYTKARDDMKAYLAGEKTALVSPQYKTGDVDIIGLTHWATTENSVTGEEEYRPVFFTGYGHFEEISEDMHLFQDLGNNAVQLGNSWSITSLMALKDKAVPYFKVDSNKYNCSYELLKNSKIARSGSTYLKISSNQALQSNTYSILTQEVAVEPNTTYEFGATIKGTDVNGASIWPINWANNDNRHRINGTYDWKKVTYEYTTGPNETKAAFRLASEDVCGELLIDDMFYRKKGTKDNLLSNGNLDDGRFEDIGRFRFYTYKLDSLAETLENADENNINVSLLLSPHYFIADWVKNEAFKDLKKQANWMNLKNEEAKEILEIYARKILTEAVKHESVKNICITNEPTLRTNQYGDFYKQDFADFLRELHGDISVLNEKYDSNYTAFEEVPWPDSTAPSPLFYDWKQFNDMVVYEWYLWWTDVIRTYAPGIPLHSKIMSTNFEDDSALRVHMNYGSSYENYALFSDVNGCDAFNYYSPVKQEQKLGNNTNPTTTDALEKTQWYEMLTSNMFRPVYNTEDHVIVDSSGNYVPENAIHIGADNWQGAIHGRGYSNYWVWVSHHLDSATRNSFQTRPDAIYEVSKTTLDMNRLSYEVAAIADKQPEVAIMISDHTSRVYQYAYENAVYKAFEASLYTGVKTSFITDRYPERAHMHDVVICPNTVNVRREVLEEMIEYAKSGKKLILLGEETLTRNEYNKPHDAELIQELMKYAHVIPVVNDAFKMTEPKDLKKQLANIYDELGLRPVKVVYADTGYDADMIEYIYTNHNGKILVNLCLYDWTDDQDIKIIVNGEAVTASKELRSMQDMGEIIHLKTHEPILLEIDTGIQINKPEIKLQVDNSVMTINGVRKVIDSKSRETVPVIVNDRVLMPIRTVIEAIGGEVLWDEQTRETTLKYNGIELKLIIGSNVAYADGIENIIDVSPQIINNRMMLPLRFIAEKFNLNVKWDEAGRLITVTQ